MPRAPPRPSRLESGGPRGARPPGEPAPRTGGSPIRAPPAAGCTTRASWKATRNSQPRNDSARTPWPSSRTLANVVCKTSSATSGSRLTPRTNTRRSRAPAPHTMPPLPPRRAPPRPPLTPWTADPPRRRSVWPFPGSSHSRSVHDARAAVVISDSDRCLASSISSSRGCSFISSVAAHLFGRASRLEEGGRRANAHRPRADSPLCL